MRILMALLSVMAALTLIGLGAASASAATVETAPCHEAVSPDMSGHHGMTDDDVPKPPAKAMKLMACCIACTAAAPVAPEAAPIRFARPGVQPAPQPIRTGLIPAPEPEPPKA